MKAELPTGGSPKAAEGRHAQLSLPTRQPPPKLGKYTETPRHPPRFNEDQVIRTSSLAPLNGLPNAALKSSFPTKCVVLVCDLLRRAPSLRPHKYLHLTTNGNRMSNPQNNQPRYKAGDIVDGHILTSQNQWVPLAQEPAAPQAASRKPKWYLHKPLLITVAVIVLFGVIGSINRAARSDDNAGSIKSAAVAEQPAPGDEAAAGGPKDAPAAEAGTAANPMPQPYVAKGPLGGEKYSLTGRVAADAPDVTQWNMYNDPAPAGFKWVVVELTMTGIDKDGVEPALAIFDLALSTPEGNTYNSESGLVLGDGMPKMRQGPTLYPGSAFTGNMTFLVPDTATGFMLYDNGSYVTL